MNTIQVPLTTTRAKGGMSPRAFGSHTRIDKCNLQGSSFFGDELIDVTSNASPERVLWLSSIQDAAHNYLMFGLGKNGTTASEFFYAARFFFNVRADKPETWQTARVLREVAYDDKLGRRVNRVQRIPDETLQFMCLDRLWVHLQFPMDLETFTRRLRAERSNLLRRNWSQVCSYLGLHRTFEECESALVCPASPEVLTSLLYSSRTSSLAAVAA